MGWGTHHEMELMAAAGVSNLQILRAATSSGARLLSKDQPPIYGTIEPGKRADLILLNADPLLDIANTQKIGKVMQAGNWVF